MGCVVFCSFLCIEVCVAESNVFVIFTLVVDDFVDDFPVMLVFVVVSVCAPGAGQSPRGNRV